MQAMTSKSDINKQLEFQKQISDLESKLYRPGIESEFSDESQKKQFKLDRLQWSMFVRRVELDIASVLMDKLELNKAGFEAGIQAINQHVQAINDTVGFLDLLSCGLGIISKIIRLGS